MLEYALKQERAKFHKLKYGVDLQQGDMKPPVDDPVNEIPGDSEAPFSSVSNVTWRQGRQLLRQYLQEIGYTDTIIDVRSNRVRSLLGLNNNEQEENLNGSNINNTNESNKRASENPGRRTPAKKAQPSSMAEAMMLDTEAAVMANFEFLQQQDVDMEDDDDMSDDLDLDTTEEVDDDDVRSVKRKGKTSIILNEALADDVDAEAEEVLNELNLLTEVSECNDREERMNRTQSNTAPDWSQGSYKIIFLS